MNDRSPLTAPLARRVSGSGPNLVLIHGVAADSDSFARLEPALRSSFTVVTVDRRGRGGSPDIEPYEVEQEFADIVDLVEELGSPTILFGHSFGGNLALAAAVRSTAIAGVVAYEPGHPADGSDERLIEFERLLEQDDRRGMLRLALREFASFPEEFVDELLDVPVWQERLALAHTIPRELRGYRGYDYDELRGLRTPVLLLVGSESSEQLQVGAASLAELIPTARLRVLDGHGHVATFTAPDLVARELRRFALEVGLLNR